VARFAATGNPNARGLPPWPALRTTKPLAMELGDAFAPLPAADSDAKFAFLKAYLLSQPTEH
jgi:carboxylesterase type B